MEIEKNEMVVRLRFDRPLTDEEAVHMAEAMAEEMEFRRLSGGRYLKPGWGIGRARVLEVVQLLPGDLAGVESGEMLALRLQEAGRADLAADARAGRGRAWLLRAILGSAEPDLEVVATVVGRPGAE
ncbi:MAG: hypothetical protein JST59_29680 [Actinobacteria bacterium]|nr:hypothetical protein [Actinomycetota bacterium]